MDTKKTATEILKEVGGKDNIKEMFHCVTRLRFYLRDTKVVDLEKIKKIDGVLGAQFSNDQLQIIIGNEVGDVYDAAYAQTGFIHNEETLAQKKKFKATGIFEVMAAILIPVVPVLAGAGMIKGLITIMTSYLGFDSASALIQVMTMAGDCAFYFLPFLVAWSASKRFNTDTAISIALAGVLLYPTMTAGNLAGAEAMSLFGLPIPFPRYYGSTIPIILTVWVLSYVYKFVDKHIHKSIRLVFTPMVVLLIMTPLTLGVLGPLANYISKALVVVVKFLYELSPLVAGAIVGGTRLFVVMTGMHLSLGTIAIENIATFGSDFLLPMNTMGTLALFGACLGVWIRGKKTETKSVGMSTTISSFIGITEPGIYGVFLKYKTAMLASIIGGAAGGAIVGAFGGRATAYVNSCILSLPVFMGAGAFWSVCLGMAVAAGVAFAIVMVLGVDEGDDEKKTAVEAEAKVTPVEEGGKVTILSPMDGEIKALPEIDDEVFASGAMGKGVAIVPKNGTIVAPFNGTVTALYPTKHAIGLTSENGVQVIIHIGMDTANLQGKYFDVKVEQGQTVTAGSTLVEVDLINILKEGYSLVSPIVVANSDDYLDVIPFETSGEIFKGEVLLTVVK